MEDPSKEAEWPHREDYSERSYTYIDDVFTPGWQCDDCGAYAETKEKIEHYESCKPGESEYWMEFYSRAEEEEDCDDVSTDENGIPLCNEPFSGFMGE